MSGSDIREEVLQLMLQKDKIEEEIKQLFSILTKNGVGMNDPLMDTEGFPISSIDVYQVRHARQRIICLQNDHKNLMNVIENGLHGYYGSTSSTALQPQSMDINYDTEVVHHITPFAKVALVSPGSPAEYAGIQCDDLLVEFGSVNYENFRALQDIAGVVQHSEGQQVHVKVKRGERFVVTQLIPKRWHGKGLLGCSIVLLSS